MTTNEEWRGDWQAAEDEILRAGLLATPEQRLEWLEEALKLAQAARLSATTGDKK